MNRWIDRSDRKDDGIMLDRLTVVNRILGQLVAAVWLAVLGYVVALVWLAV